VPQLVAWRRLASPYPSRLAVLPGRIEFACAADCHSRTQLLPTPLCSDAVTLCFLLFHGSTMRDFHPLWCAPPRRTRDGSPSVPTTAWAEEEDGDSRRLVDGRAKAAWWWTPTTKIPRRPRQSRRQRPPTKNGKLGEPSLPLKGSRGRPLRWTFFGTRTTKLVLRQPLLRVLDFCRRSMGLASSSSLRKARRSSRRQEANSFSLRQLYDVGSILPTHLKNVG
jgi:hypothetical protein